MVQNMNVIIATIKSWNIERAYQLQEEYKGLHQITVYTNKDEVTIENIEKHNPDMIFFPHWSYIIPEEITKKWNCVVFHMTDLPYGRGGSPLQNLIVRGHKKTKISAIKVTQEIDAGPIYMKKELDLSGTAREIYVRAADVIFKEMIPEFFKEIPKLEKQTGKVTIFKRRKLEDGKIAADMCPEKIYDYIRMLDAEGYPRAYLEWGDYKLEFEQPVFSEEENIVEARVVFRRKENV